MTEMYVYHVVTERPMKVGQHIMFDEKHHTRVALRELALEEVRKREYPKYPSRLGSLYVSNSMEEARRWAEMFVRWGRPTYDIVKLKIKGSIFTGDANNCFDATTDKKKNILLARHYWDNLPNQQGVSN